MTRRATPEFLKARKELFANGPMTCAVCHKAPATEADHIIPYDAGGPDTLENLRPVCKPCNSRLGARYVNAKRTAQNQRRSEAMGLPPLREGITQVPPRTCLTCNIMFTPDWRNVERGGGKYCSQQCSGMGQRLPRWNITHSWSCSICAKRTSETTEVKAEHQPTLQPTDKQTCGDTQCNYTLNAIRNREAYRLEHPECKPRDSKYSDPMPTEPTVTIERVNTKDVNIFKNEDLLSPPTFFSRISQKSHDSVQNGLFPPLTAGVGSDQPRLETPVYGYESYGPLIAEFAAAHLGRELFPWQVNVLTGAFEHDNDGAFTHSSAMAFCARQQGKTYMLSSVVGFALLELPRIWGRPVKVVSTAHELSLATEVFEDLRDLFELWEESGLCKVTWAYGRHRVKMVDGSEYLVKAATGKKHGISGVDILIVDELWAITEAAYFGALKPAQIAVKSGLSLLVSTAGDESSTVMKKLREQAIGQIDKGEPGELYMAEWSVPESVSPDDERYWGYANPSMPRTVTLKSLRAAHASPDRSQWLRAHCNMWVSAASSWLPPGQWAKRTTTNIDWDGTTSVLAVDSAVDDSKYVGVWCRKNTDGDIVASIEFQTESIAEMWERITQALEREPKTQLAITPSLFIHTPEKFQRRTVQWGYGEINKYTSTVKGLINENRVKHTGEVLLSEHVNRAVLIRGQGGALSISSQRSPGPIEACRCLIVAVAMVSRPGQANKPTMGSSR